MSKDNDNGLGIISVLTLIFIVLKLADLVDWSWWWVFSPIWIPVVAVGSILLFVSFIVWAINR